MAKGKRMRKAPRALRVAVSLGIVGLATSLLVYFKLTAAGLQHPIFIYLPLIALLAFALGSMAALSGAAAAIAAAGYLLYDPAYTFTFTDALEIGDLLWFALLAVIVVKCTRILRRSGKQAKSRFGMS